MIPVTVELYQFPYISEQSRTSPYLSENLHSKFCFDFVLYYASCGESFLSLVEWSFQS